MDSPLGSYSNKSAALEVIEQLVLTLPTVRAAACVHVKEAGVGEQFCLCLSLHDGMEKPSLKSLEAFLTMNAAGAEPIFGYLIFYRALPKNTKGLVDRDTLQKRITELLC